MTSFLYKIYDNIIHYIDVLCDNYVFHLAGGYRNSYQWDIVMHITLDVSEEFIQVEQDCRHRQMARITMITSNTKTPTPKPIASLNLCQLNSVHQGKDGTLL